MISWSCHTLKNKNIYPARILAALACSTRTFKYPFNSSSSLLSHCKNIALMPMYIYDRIVCKIQFIFVKEKNTLAFLRMSVEKHCYWNIELDIRFIKATWASVTYNLKSWNYTVTKSLFFHTARDILNPNIPRMLELRRSSNALW